MAHGHVHHGKTSKDILSAEEVIEAADINEGDVFLDAGCGDGYISLEASKVVGDQGMVYALDVYSESIETVKNEIEKNNLNNVETILADMTKEIPVDESSVDKIIMANVLHGFVESEEVDAVMNNITKAFKSGGIFTVVEFRKVKSERGPPYNVRLAPSDVSEILEEYGFSVIANNEIGKYHYIVKGLKSP